MDRPDLPAGAARAGELGLPEDEFQPSSAASGLAISRLPRRVSLKTWVFLGDDGELAAQVLLSVATDVATAEPYSPVMGSQKRRTR